MTDEAGGHVSRVFPRPLFILSSLTALLALAATAGGLFWPRAGEPFPFTTLRANEIEIYGRGLYHYDWAFRAPILRGADAVMLLVVAPLLTSLLGVFLYNAASAAFGVAFNPFFSVYTVMMLLGGYVPSAGENALYVAPFLLLSLISVWLLAVLLRHVDVG